MRLERFRWSSPEARQLVDASGVSHLGRVMSLNLDLPLLLAFVERWQTDTNTFHMPFREITITLHDVLYLLRLSIRGTQLSSEGDRAYVSQLATMLNVDGDEIRRKCYRASGFHLDHLVEAVEAGYLDDASTSICYLMALLGSTVFCDRSQNRVHIGVLEGLRDVRMTREYSWGAATLAFLYRQLGVASRAGSTSLSGCLTLLRSWIYEYFPSLRCRQTPAPRARGEALAGRWKGPRIVERATDVDLRVETLQSVLDGMTHAHVDWLPFGPPDFDGEARWSMYSGGIHAFDYVEPTIPAIRCVSTATGRRSRIQFIRRS